jgi:hypothetical protein
MPPDLLITRRRIAGADAQQLLYNTFERALLIGAPFFAVDRLALG